jgi:plastocyanin
MMPRNLNLSVGDSVHWTWGSESELHTVSFPANSPTLPPPFIPDCGGPGTDDIFIPAPNPANSYCGDSPPSFANFEIAGDPGNARPGELTNTKAFVDSGLLVGADYGLTPSVQDWTATAGTPSTSAPSAASTPVRFAYQCTVHDWMQAAVTVG